MKKRSLAHRYFKLFLVSAIFGFITFLIISFFFVRAFTWKLMTFSAVLGPIIGNMIGFSCAFIGDPISQKLKSVPRPFSTLFQALTFFVVSLAAASLFFLLMDLSGVMAGLPANLLLVFLLIAAAIGVIVTLFMSVYDHLKTELEKSYEKLKEKELLEKELEMARQVQAGFLPLEEIQIEGYQVSTYFQSAKEVGGDYFDFIPLNKGVGIAIADVSGKGVPASLVMTNVHATLHALADDYSLEELLSRMNRSLLKNTAPGIFVTFFYGVLDPKTGKLEYVNAGHNPPLLVRQTGIVEELARRSIGLGLSAGARFETGSITLNEGDTLILFTDGLTEAGLPHLEPWGEENLKRYLPSIYRETALGMTELILDKVKAPLRGIPQTDDIALVLVKREQGR